MLESSKSSTSPPLELSSNNIPHSSLSPLLWYIHGLPYDLNTWADVHPGGRHLLDASRGTDCTALFESYHAASLQSQHIRTTMQKYQVHDAPPGPPTLRNWSHTPVYDDMKRVVRAYRRLNGIKATDDWSMVVWFVAAGILHCVTLARWLAGIGGWCNSIGLGLGVWYFCGSALHDGTHYALTHDVQTSEWIGWLGGWMFCMPNVWLRQHVTQHHVHTNDAVLDPDLHHFQKFFRIDPRQPPSQPGTKQWRCSKSIFRYAIPLFAQFHPWLILTFKLWFLSIWREKPVTWVHDRERMQIALANFACVALVCCAVYVNGMILTIIPFAVVGVLFYLFSQVSHVNTASFEKPTSEEWAVHQIYAAQGDYAYKSNLWCRLSLGLNNQTLHHCFPNVHPCHYPKLSVLIKPLFLKHQIPRSGWKQTYLDSLQLHCEHLDSLNVHLNPKGVVRGVRLEKEEE